MINVAGDKGQRNKRARAVMLQFVREGYEPRPLQKEILTELHDCWNTYDVFVIRASVGSGKSLIADTIANHNKAQGLSTSIIVPSNPLVRQYANAFKDMAVIKNSFQYGGGTAFMRAKTKWKASSVKLANYYTYLANKGYSHTLVVDEAHSIIPTLTDMDAVKVWRHLTGIPKTNNILEIMRWAVDNQDNHATVKKLAKVLERNPDEYIIEEDVRPYRGKQREVVMITPITPKNNKPVFWPKSVKKIVLMSATLGIEDIYDMGFKGKRVKVIDAGNPIPKQRRPIYYTPVGNMSYKSQKENMPKLATKIRELLANNQGSKGMIHVTYSMAGKLEAMLGSKEPRLLFHNRWNKQARLEEFLSSSPEDGLVLVGCGLSEGLDLAGDKGRWQAICKIQYPNLKDKAVAKRLKTRPNWYVWSAIKHLEQAYGRICRGPEDYGKTYILDSAYARLHKYYKHMFSEGFKEAIHIGENDEI